MKKLLNFLVFAGFWCAAQAAPLKLTVHSDAGEALWYVYVYVNGRAVAVTDTCGVAQVPEEKLNVGDTLSVSYVGTEPQWVVYDKALKKQNEYFFILSEKYDLLVAKEVVVKVDLRKYFRKNTKECVAEEGFSSNVLTADFRMVIRTPEGGQRIIEGLVTGSKNSTAHKDGITGYHRMMRINTHSDMTGIFPFLYRNLVLAMKANTVAVINAARDRKQDNMQLKYFGKQDGCRVFRIVFPEQEGVYFQQGRYQQVLVRIDEQTKLPCSMEYNVTDFKNGLKYSVQADFVGQVPEKGYYKTHGWGVMHTSRSSMQIVYSNGTMVDLELLNPKLTYKSGKSVW
ncbi:hypothetical protein [uncultured Rikenella sp.]|uniref:hypothetical protein n=1 Tax=uncultured Rikenella sp. TaxID=368003 RepID=UPI00263428F5|nr:hypothetical protein [uncultured Rikenella sp.]